MFKENSALVRMWVNKILEDKTGEITVENVPNMSNLKEMVALVLEKK